MRRAVLESDRAAIKAANRSVRALGKQGRRKLDLYETCELAVVELRKRVRIEGVVYEVCNGLGAISRHFGDCDVVTNDIDPSKIADRHEDAATMAIRIRPAWVVTNTPFGELALPIVRNFVEQGARCAFLLLLSFLEPTYQRGDWLEAHPPVSQIVLPRHSFTGDGQTFQETCAWFLWGTAPLVPPIQIVSKGPPERAPKRKLVRT